MSTATLTIADNKHNVGRQNMNLIIKNISFPVTLVFDVEAKTYVYFVHNLGIYGIEKEISKDKIDEILQPRNPHLGDACHTEPAALSQAIDLLANLADELK
jgi:hypothetical protein